MFAFGRLKVCRVGQVMELATWSTPVFTVDAAPNRSRFRCAYCGMRVETGAPYPSTMATAIYDGVRYGRFGPRPPCPGPKLAR
jgi:hypothetical protein